MNFKSVKQLIAYGICGVLTTVINIFTYWLARNFEVSIASSAIIAWLVAVLFAYWSNRKFVFESTNTSIIAIFFEAVYFFMCRIATGLLDIAIMYIFADVLGCHEVITKTVSNIIVIIVNYVASKLFIFKEGKK